MQHSNTAGCILLKFYIKPQHTANVYNLLYVVSYRNSTSNHNLLAVYEKSSLVVSYRNSTSNHNAGASYVGRKALYLIEILHQTTTDRPAISHAQRCILSKFYIKPQLIGQRFRTRSVVSYRNSTSNHNALPRTQFGTGVVSYRNSTSNHNQIRGLRKEPVVVSYRNSTSNHNINTLKSAELPVVSYRNSTSNHNGADDSIHGFYVVSYRNSTSNHNKDNELLSSGFVVSYRNSTSNHNAPASNT